jgi:hypothetical protein
MRPAPPGPCTARRNLTQSKPMVRTDSRPRRPRARHIGPSSHRSRLSARDSCDSPPMTSNTMSVPIAKVTAEVQGLSPLPLWSRLPEPIPAFRPWRAATTDPSPTLRSLARRSQQARAYPGDRGHQRRQQTSCLACLAVVAATLNFLPQTGSAGVCRLDRYALAPRAQPSLRSYEVEAVEAMTVREFPSSWLWFWR